MERSIKDVAKEAKLRMKSGFWQENREKLRDKMNLAKENGVCASEVIEYYVRQTEKGTDDDSFYVRVKSILDSEGEVSDILGRLTDRSFYGELDYSAKQRYMLELSEKYQKALARYKKECIFK